MLPKEETMQIKRKIARSILGCSITEFDAKYAPKLIETAPQPGHHAPTYDEAAVEALAATLVHDVLEVHAGPDGAPASFCVRKMQAHGGNSITGGGPQKTTSN